MFEQWLLDEIINESVIKRLAVINDTRTSYGKFLGEGDVTAILGHLATDISSDPLENGGNYLSLPISKSKISETLINLAAHAPSAAKLSLNIPVCSGNPKSGGHWTLVSVTVKDKQISRVEYSDSLAARVGDSKEYSESEFANLKKLIIDDRLSLFSKELLPLISSDACFHLENRKEQNEPAPWSCADHTIIQALRKIGRMIENGYSLNYGTYADGELGARQLRDITARLVRARVSDNVSQRPTDRQLTPDEHISIEFSKIEHVEADGRADILVEQEKAMAKLRVKAQKQLIPVNSNFFIILTLSYLKASFDLLLHIAARIFNALSSLFAGRYFKSNPKAELNSELLSAVDFVKGNSIVNQWLTDIEPDLSLSPTPDISFDQTDKSSEAHSTPRTHLSR